MQKLFPFLAATLAVACSSSSSESGPDVAGTYPIVSKQFANGGSFPCDTPLSDNDTRNAFAVVTDGDFGIDVDTCNEDRSDCFPVFLELNDATTNGYSGESSSASSSGGLCSLNHVTSVMIVGADGALTIEVVDRYESGDIDDCTLAAAEKISNGTTCTGVEKIVTGPRS